MPENRSFFRLQGPLLYQGTTLVVPITSKSSGLQPLSTAFKSSKDLHLASPADQPALSIPNNVPCQGTTFSRAVNA
jgi:hypothetical protein